MRTVKPLVTVVGVGALGSHLVILSRNWDAEVKIIDFDRVETKNIAAQFHTYMGAGKNKAVALQAAMQGLFKTRIQAVCTELNQHNVDRLLGDSSLVVDCTDNYDARANIQGYCSEADVPCLHCALAGSGDYARIVWSEDFVIDREGSQGEATCEDGQALPFHTQAAALAAQEVRKYLAGGKQESWHLTPFSVLRIA